MNRAQIRIRLLPWGGLIGSVLGGGIAHQVGSDSVINRCATASPAVVLVAGIVGLVLVGGGAFASWLSLQRREAHSGRRLIAFLSLALSALMALAIVLPMVASLVIPPCFG